MKDTKLFNQNSDHENGQIKKQISSRVLQTNVRSTEEEELDFGNFVWDIRNRSKQQRLVNVKQVPRFSYRFLAKKSGVDYNSFSEFSGS